MRYLILILTILSLNIFSNGHSIYNQNFPGVVIIVTDDGIGSGAIITESGFVLTNAHVVGGNKEVEILIFGGETFEESSHRARVLKVDSTKDLALVKIIKPKFQFEVIEISIVMPKVGEEAHAIGHPDSELWTYTKGYISQLRPDYQWEYINGEKMHATVIQIQTPINPGNSGGPLLNKHGNLIGINAFANLDKQLMNFAISVEEIIKFLGGRN